MNRTEEVACGFVVARDDAAVLLELGKEVLNQMARYVHMPVEAAWLAVESQWSSCEVSTGSFETLRDETWAAAGFKDTLLRWKFPIVCDHLHQHW